MILRSYSHTAYTHTHKERETHTNTLKHTHIPFKLYKEENEQNVSNSDAENIHMKYDWTGLLAQWETFRTIYRCLLSKHVYLKTCRKPSLERKINYIANHKFLLHPQNTIYSSSPLPGDWGRQGFSTMRAGRCAQYSVFT